MTAEVQSNDSEGAEKYVFCTASALHNANGDTVGAIETIRDITPLKQTMNELIEARRRAEAATEAKSEFLANMSHEIRTPLNAILGLSNLCLRTQLTEKQYDYLTKIEMSSQNLLGIISDILDFSRIEAGKLEMESSDFDLWEAMDNLTNMFSAKSAKKEIELIVNMSPEVPRFLIGDALRLGQVLINLTSNAVKFTDSGEVVVTVELIENMNNQATLKFSVRDTGIGIAADKLPDLFLAFTQVDGSTTRQYGGTGIGLAICKRIVEMMQGQIWVESDEGRGSCFQFTAVFGCQLASNTQPAMIPKDLHVLLVEDNPINQQVALGILKKAGTVVSVADNGEKAVSMFKKGVYDIILMDVQMPVMDGFAATQAIRKVESEAFSASGTHDTDAAGDAERAENRSPGIPVIAMTAHAMKGDREKCIAAGMNDYVTKPIDVGKLFSALDHWVPKDAARRMTDERVPDIEAPDPQDDLGQRLPGIDVASALQRLGGNRRLLKKLLLEFHSDYAGIANDIREAVGAGVTEVALRYAHTIKGVAGNFSAKDLMVASGELENGIRNGNIERLGPLIDTFEGAMTEICRVVARLRDSADESEISPAQPAQPSRLAEQLNKLARLLRDQDLDAEDCIASIKQDMGGADYQSDLDDIEKRIRRLDFENARVRLSHLAKQMGIALEIG